jgi:hypothetical protein
MHVYVEVGNYKFCKNDLWARLQYTIQINTQSDHVTDFNNWPFSSDAETPSY